MDSLYLVVSIAYSSALLMCPVSHRPTSMKKLGLTLCYTVTNERFTQFIRRCPLLEDLSLEHCQYINGPKVYEATGKACAHLKHFNLKG